LGTPPEKIAEDVGTLAPQRTVSIQWAYSLFDGPPAVLPEVLLTP